MSTIRSVLCHTCQEIAPLYSVAGVECYDCINCGNGHAFVSYNDFLQCEQMIKIADAEQLRKYREDFKKDWHPELGWGQWKYWRTEDAPLDSLGHWEFWKAKDIVI